jgi:hypothetical protein
MSTVTITVINNASASQRTLELTMSAALRNANSQVNKATTTGFG